MVKILMLSDSPTTCTGYATIATNIMNGLAELGHECHYQAHNYVGQTVPPGMKFEDGRELKFTLYGQGKEAYAKDVIVPRIRELKPDIFIVLLDTFMLYQTGYLNLDFAPAKTIFYFPSDGGGALPLRCEEILKKFHVPVAMAKFGQEQALTVHGIKTEYIPHAIDQNVYFPLGKEQREILKAKYGLQGKFVFGSVYRNQGRKMADRMFKAFAKFAKGYKKCTCGIEFDSRELECPIQSKYKKKIIELENTVKRLQENTSPGQEELIILKRQLNSLNEYKKEYEEKIDLKHTIKLVKGNEDAILFCHSDPYDGAAVFDSMELIKRLGIENRVRFSGMTFFKGFDYKQMNEVYNVMDVFTLSTSGEGFGVPTIEAMGCGIPCVVTDFTTTQELLIERGVCGLAVPCCANLTGSWNVERGIVDVDKLAEAYQMMYDSPTMREEMGRIGIEKIDKFYNWDTVIKDWDKLVRKMVDE